MVTLFTVTEAPNHVLHVVLETDVRHQRGAFDAEPVKRNVHLLTFVVVKDPATFSFLLSQRTIYLGLKRVKPPLLNLNVFCECLAQVCELGNI